MLSFLNFAATKQTLKGGRNIQESKVYNIKVGFDPSVILKSLDTAEDNENFDIQDFIKNFKKVSSTPTTSSTTTTETTTTTTTTTTTKSVSTTLSSSLITSLSPSHTEPHSMLTTADEGVNQQVKHGENHDGNRSMPPASTFLVPSSSASSGNFVKFMTSPPVFPRLPLLYYFSHPSYYPMPATPTFTLQYLWPVSYNQQHNIVNYHQTMP